MASAGLQLLDLLEADDPFGASDEEILPLQIAAADESFQRLRRVIRCWRAGLRRRDRRDRVA